MARLRAVEFAHGLLADVEFFPSGERVIEQRLTLDGNAMPVTLHVVHFERVAGQQMFGEP